MALITGNTYPHRSELRAMGGEWDVAAKGWRVPDERAEEARALVAGAVRGRGGVRGKYRHDANPRNVSNVTRFSSGAVVYQNKRGRCEDAPCCGCCS